VEAIQSDPENVSTERDVSILIGGESYNTLKENTQDLDRYNDPLKVLHQTLYPEDHKRAEQDELLKPKGRPID
jgi:hypothetical protein